VVVQVQQLTDLSDWFISLFSTSECKVCLQHPFGVSVWAHVHAVN